jgi:hypothetical protein
MKLKELYIKELNSESYKKQVLLIRAFADKVNFYDKSKINLIKDLPSIILWIKENFEQTDFKSMDEVTAEMEKIIKAQAEVMKENKEFNDSMIETVAMLGPEILSSVIHDVMYMYPEKFNLRF